jgi:hypothetical protein
MPVLRVHARPAHRGNVDGGVVNVTTWKTMLCAVRALEHALARIAWLREQIDPTVLHAAFESLEHDLAAALAEVKS